MSDLGFVSKIQRFSLHDGDGVRTTVFLKGCNLRCKWCHNPETIKSEISIQTYFESKCIGCKECFNVCPSGAHKLVEGKHIIDRDLCIHCGKCGEVCFAGAIVINGIHMSVSQIMNEVMKDEALYKSSNGGLTISGGEPLLQVEFVKSLLIDAKSKGLNTAIDTAGNVDFNLYESINDYVDTYLYDLKCIDDKMHQELTSVSNLRILENLVKLNNISKKIYVRMPIMKGKNDDLDFIRRTAQFIKPLDKVDHIDVLPIHTLAQDKYRSLDLNYDEVVNNPPVSKDEVNKIIEVFNEYGIIANNH